MYSVNLLPFPRSLNRNSGFYTLPTRAILQLEPELPRDRALKPIAERLRTAARELGIEMQTVIGVGDHPHPAIRALQTAAAPAHAEGYRLRIRPTGIFIEYRQAGGLRAAVATLRQLLREYGRRLPQLSIR